MKVSYIWIIPVVVVTVVASATPCVTRATLRKALQEAAYQVTIKGGYYNQASWREQAFKKVYEKYKGRAVCLEK